MGQHADDAVEYFQTRVLHIPKDRIKRKPPKQPKNDGDKS